MHIFSHLLIYWYNLLSLSLWLYNLSVIIFKWSKVKDYFQMLLLWVIFIQTLYFKVLSFGVLDFILVLLIVYIFFCAERISVCWSWNFSLGVIENCMWAYPNQIYGFAPPAGLWKSVVRVLVGYSYLFRSIDCFSLSIISFKLFVQALFFVVVEFFIAFTISAFIGLETFSERSFWGCQFCS